jgi:hypothetical protein
LIEAGYPMNVAQWKRGLEFLDYLQIAIQNENRSTFCGSNTFVFRALSCVPARRIEEAIRAFRQSEIETFSGMHMFYGSCFRINCE